jgi:hypothetical protein
LRNQGSRAGHSAPPKAQNAPPVLAPVHQLQHPGDAEVRDDVNDPTPFSIDDDAEVVSRARVHDVVDVGQASIRGRQEEIDVSMSMDVSCSV